MANNDKNLRGLGFDEQLRLSGFEKESKSNSCMRLGDIAHDSDPGWQTLFQNKINSAQKDGYSAYCIHENGWHGYYESKTKDCSKGICNCGKKAATPSPKHNRFAHGLARDYSKFQRGSGCFTCMMCGKHTRQTEGNTANEEMCISCINESEKHNYYQDNPSAGKCTCKDCKPKEAATLPLEEKWCPFCENHGASCNCTALEIKLRESNPKTTTEELTNMLARTCVAPMDCGFTGKLHDPCEFGEYAKRREVSEQLKNDVVCSMKYSAMVDLLEYFILRYNLMHEDAMRGYTLNWNHHNPKAAVKAEKDASPSSVKEVA